MPEHRDRRPPTALNEKPGDGGLTSEFEVLEAILGFVPNAMRMAEKRPEIVRAVIGLTKASRRPADLEDELCDLLPVAASVGSGCTYCQAHTAFAAARNGVPEETIRDLWDLDAAESVDARYRSALVFAREAARAPSRISDAQMDAVRADYTDERMLDICGVAALFGWLAHWNTSLRVPLEPEPLEFAERALSAVGWQRGPH